MREIVQMIDFSSAERKELLASNPISSSGMKRKSRQSQMKEN